MKRLVWLCRLALLTGPGWCSDSNLSAIQETDLWQKIKDRDKPESTVRIFRYLEGVPLIQASPKTTAQASALAAIFEYLSLRTNDPCCVFLPEGQQLADTNGIKGAPPGVQHSAIIDDCIVGLYASDHLDYIAKCMRRFGETRGYHLRIEICERPSFEDIAEYIDRGLPVAIPFTGSYTNTRGFMVIRDTGYALTAGYLLDGTNRFLITHDVNGDGTMPTNCPAVNLRGERPAPLHFLKMEAGRHLTDVLAISKWDRNLGSGAEGGAAAIDARGQDGYAGVSTARSPAKRVGGDVPYRFSTLAVFYFKETTGPAGRTRDAYRAPRGIAVDSAGNIYVADDADVINRVTPDGKIFTWAGGAGCGFRDGVRTQAQFRGPGGMVCDSSNNVYVADTSNHVIRRITPDGMVSTVAGTPKKEGYVDGSAGKSRFHWPSSIAMHQECNLYVTDVGNHTVRKISQEGTVTTLAGKHARRGYFDGKGTEALFYRPQGIAVFDSDVFVVDSGNGVIRKISADGVVSTLAGQPQQIGHSDGIGTNAQFCGPSGLVVDNQGILYVADEINDCIRRVTADGKVTTIGGKYLGKNEKPMFSRVSADGVGPAARFNRPGALAIDKDGVLHIADTEDKSLRLGRPLRTAWERANPFTKSTPILDRLKASERKDYPF